MNDDELDKRLRSLPRETDPPVDYWPGIRRNARRGANHGLRAAAAAIIFFVGLAAGRVSVLKEESAMAVTPEGIAPTPFLLSTEIQRNGTAYLSALAQLRGLAPTTHDTLSVRQGYEAAVAVMEDASRQIAGSFQELSPGLVSEAARARAIAAHHVKVALAKRSQ